jgi:hypothetical protein
LRLNTRAPAAAKANVEHTGHHRRDLADIETALARTGTAAHGPPTGA